MFAALYAAEGSDAGAVLDVGRAFSPRVEAHLPREVVLDLDGLTRLFGDARTIGAEIRRTAADRKLQLRVAIAGSRTASRLLARHRAGLTLASDGDLIDAESDRAAVAEVPLEQLADIWSGWTPDDAARDAAHLARAADRVRDGHERVRTLRRWGLRTLGDLAALPPDDVAARLGPVGVEWWHMARGEDLTPLVPSLPEERFEQAIDLEWPIEGLEPLSFVLGRLFEPLSAHLERRDRGVAVLHIRLHLVTKVVHELSLQLPTPIRDPKALRTLALLSLETNPAPAGIDRVVVAVDPTPGRVIQHSLLTRAVPMPEDLATLMARLNALMGEGRCGSPAVVDTWKPGAYAVAPFLPDTTSRDVRPSTTPLHSWNTEGVPAKGTASLRGHANEGASGDPWNTEGVPAKGTAPALALRRFRSPVPARVTVEQGRPVRVVTDRRGLTGGRVDVSAGPWRTSGNWWEEAASTPGTASNRVIAAWDRDEWDVTLADGATYRLFTERGTKAWFVDGLFD
jgi:protein ImuB